jgi:hypothetical protein
VEGTDSSKQSHFVFTEKLGEELKWVESDEYWEEIIDTWRHWFDTFAFGWFYKCNDLSTSFFHYFEGLFDYKAWANWVTSLLFLNGGLLVTWITI